MRIDALFKELAKRRAVFKRIYIQLMLSDWNEIIGDKLAEHVYPKKIEDDILYLHYDDPLFASEVRMRSNEIIKLLNERLSGISSVRNIKFVRRGD